MSGNAAGKTGFAEDPFKSMRERETFLYSQVCTVPHLMTRMCHVERLELLEFNNVHIDAMMRHCDPRVIHVV
jgi:hypothetical protein